MKLLILMPFVLQTFIWSCAKGSQDSQMTSSVSTYSDVDASSLPVFGLRCEYKMADCVVRGHVFLNHFAKRIRKDKRAMNCSRYLSFRDCFIPLLSNECRHLEPQYSTWRPIVEQMDCLCNRSGECPVDQRCVFRELNGYWASRCNDFYRFNLRQKTRDQCHFLEENFRCLETLVSSACGDMAARFASSYLEITSSRETKCRRNNDYNYTVSFRYTENCPTTFLDRVDRCTTKCLTSDAVAKFHRDNDVIVTGKKNALKAACRSLQKYRKCLKPLTDACPEGFDKVIEYGTDLRKYWIKMNFICRSDIFEVYHSHLHCYQRVMKRELKQCDVIWDDLTPWIVNMTSYQFYCEPNSTDSRNLVHQLDRLVSCHGAVFNNQCGSNASTVMVQLLQTVFANPAYLRLDYRPDCQLHAPTTTTTTTIPTTTTVTTSALSSWHGLATTSENDSATLSLGATMWQYLRGSDPKADHRRTEDVDSGAALAVTRSRHSGACIYIALVVMSHFFMTWFRPRFG